MSEEQKTTAAPAGPNVEAEKDVQNVLAELKAEEAKAGEPKADEAAKTTEDKNGAAADEAAEEAKIIAAAQKLGEDSEKKEEPKVDSKTVERGPGGQRGGRGGRPNYRNNIKSNLESQEPSSDPVAIRKQVSFISGRANGPPFARLAAVLP